MVRNRIAFVELPPCHPPVTERREIAYPARLIMNIINWVMMMRGVIHINTRAQIALLLLSRVGLHDPPSSSSPFPFFHSGTPTGDGR